jgi:hypothetical protein
VVPGTDPCPLAAPARVRVLAVVLALLLGLLGACSSAEVRTGGGPTNPPSSLAEPITVAVIGSSTATGVGSPNPAQAWV